MSTVTPDEIIIEAEHSAPAAERESRFAAAVESLRTKATAANAEKWFRLAGPVFMPLGALVIVLGWWGAANTTRLFLQIPYLISGGLLGLGLMFVGGFVYFARWMTDLLNESQRRAEIAEANASKGLEALERIEALLAASNASWYAEEGVSATDEWVEPETLVATESGKLAHRADCRLVADRSTIVLSADEVAARDFCRICQPEGP